MLCIFVRHVITDFLDMVQQDLFWLVVVRQINADSVSAGSFQVARANCALKPHPARRQTSFVGSGWVGAKTPYASVRNLCKPTLVCD